METAWLAVIESGTNSMGFNDLTRLYQTFHYRIERLLTTISLSHARERRGVEL